MTDDVPRCGAVCTSSGRRGERCRMPVASEGLRCGLHDRDDVPALEDAPKPGE